MRGTTGSQGVVAVGASIRPMVAELSHDDYDVVGVDSLDAALAHLSSVGRGRLLVLPTSWVVPEPALLQALRGRARTHLVVVDDEPSPNRAAAWLDAGADDYLARRTGRHEGLARLHAVLRRPVWGPTHQPHLRRGPLAMDVAGRSAHVGGTRLSLTQTEFELLRLLVTAEEPLRVPALALELWPDAAEEHAPEVKTFVYRLRQHLRGSGAGGVQLVTVVGRGYQLVCDSPSVTR